MKILLKDPPRQFTVGERGDIAISDVGDIHLAPNEQVTFVTESGRRHDFACKEWGFYATPSVNGRLRNEGLRTALVRNQKGLVYVMVIASEKRAAFDDYCEREKQTVLQWLDEIGCSEQGA